MPATLDEVLAEVRALREEVKALGEKVAVPTLRGVTLLAQHLGAVARPGAPATNGHGAPGAGAVANDTELDSSKGDRKIVCNPRDWNGESFKGARMSECPPDFLDVYAAMMDGFADRNTDATKAGYDRKDAARARGWARRKREQTAREREEYGHPPPLDESAADDFQ